MESVFVLHDRIRLSICDRIPGELDVVEHAVLDGRLPVHVIHVVITEPTDVNIDSWKQSHRLK